jgi:Asp-tRNA(Asn)/Glu-tRNA(Gln) amidotransferase A subunit family amidase
MRSFPPEIGNPCIEFTRCGRNSSMNGRPASAITIAGELAAGTRDRQALLAETYARIEATDSELGAFVARLELPVAQEQLKRLSGPLQGLPVAVKDIFDTRELPTRYGSTLYPDTVARTDAAIIGVIRRAGGLVIGKSSTTEFAFLQPTATRNPNAPGHTPGGSSAGSAAAVAAGLVPFAVGTQTGGSVIRPASYCGVTGFKPSFALLPTAGLKCFSWSLDTVGLFAASVAEVAWFAQALSGRALALDATRDPAIPASPARPWIVGVPEAYPWAAVSPSAQQVIGAGCRALREAGAEVKSISLPPWVKDVFEAQDVIQGYEAWRALAHEIDLNPQALSAVLRDYLLAGSRITAQAYEQAQSTASEGRMRCKEWFSHFDVLMTPSAPDEAPVGYGSTGTSIFNRAWTLLGLPCVNVTGLKGVNGYPMGLQVIGAPHADRKCLQAADFLEHALQRPF